MFEYSEDLAVKLLEFLDTVDLKADEDKEWMFDVVATTEDTDRDGEIIKIKWWDTSNWEKNPVILANHQYKIESIIGKGLKFYTSNWVKRLKGVFSKTNPLGVLAKELYREGMLNTVSVGFLVKERDANDRSVITKAELLETSFVAVPCNPNALSVETRSLYDEAVEKWLVTKQEEQEITLKDIMDAIKALNDKVDKSLTDGKVKEAETLDEDLEAKKLNAQTAQKLLQQALQNLKIAIN